METHQLSKADEEWFKDSFAPLITSKTTLADLEAMWDAEQEGNDPFEGIIFNDLIVFAEEMNNGTRCPIDGARGVLTWQGMRYDCDCNS